MNEPAQIHGVGTQVTSIVRSPFGAAPFATVRSYVVGHAWHAQRGVLVIEARGQHGTPLSYYADRLGQSWILGHYDPGSQEAVALIAGYDGVAINVVAPPGTTDRILNGEVLYL